jgi:hypothetical protein
LFFHLSGDEFPFDVPANFGLHPDWIKINHPVTTEYQEAQMLFNQGVALAYAFNHDAAYWSFKRASGKDPKMAMA